MRFVTLIAGLLLNLALWPSLARAQGGLCLSDWTAASLVVKAEGLATVEQLTKLARANGAGDIVSTTLCEDKNGFVYRLVVRDQKGQLKTISVDAKHPFER